MISMRTSPARRRGFTLVELIVVLTILAVLAALLIPALTGYIDKANEAKVLAEARTVLTAAQATVSEAYAKEQLVSSDGVIYKAANDMAKQIWELSELDPNNKKITWRFTVAGLKNPILTPGVIDTFEYCNGAYRITYHAIGTDEYPSGWDSAEKARALKRPILDDGGKPLLESSDYDPEHWH